MNKAKKSSADFYKKLIMAEKDEICRETTEVKLNILRFIKQSGFAKHIIESSDGSRIDLDKLPHDFLKQLYHFICYHLEIETVEYEDYAPPL